jgi:hypothetical protein
MKPLPPPDVPGNTEAERMDAAVRKMFSISKEDVLIEEARGKRSRSANKQKRAAHQNGG